MSFGFSNYVFCCLTRCVSEYTLQIKRENAQVSYLNSKHWKTPMTCHKNTIAYFPSFSKAAKWYAGHKSALETALTYKLLAKKLSVTK